MPPGQNQPTSGLPGFLPGGAVKATALFFFGGSVIEILVLVWVGLLLVVHEAGHLLAGLLFRAKIRQVSFGLGPGMSFRCGDINWKLGIFPVGAAVHFSETEFSQLSPFRRILIIVAGPAANLVAAVLCISVLRGEDVGYLVAAGRAVLMTAQVLEQTARALFLFDIQRFHGPVNIAIQAQEAFNGGWRDVVTFSAVGHYGLFALNMLPLPILDGGRAIMHAYEIVTGQSLSEQFQRTALLVSAAFLVLLFLAVTMKDLHQILPR